MSYFFIFLGAVLRFIPHAANFAPIGAMALFGGAKLNKKYALIVPLAAMLISDYFIGFYSWQIMASVYASFLIYGLLGLRARKNESWLKIGGATLAGSVLFFLITNFAVWAFGSMYPHTLAGLLACYAAGLPFFRGTLLGDIFFTAAFFGLYELARKYVEIPLKQKLTTKKV
ncbi:hypothetical protein EPN15_05115 [Patescibacteria group bacterium]|nr:MAG: hypothetical protein EPN15_05115 [Patescibacteria group bacterium]